VNYIYADDTAPLLPKGTVLAFTAWHDNTANNPTTPTRASGGVGRPHGRREWRSLGRYLTYLGQEDFESSCGCPKAKIK
jgi:hypothetical protein